MNDWLLRVALRKGVKRLASYGLAWFAGQAAARHGVAVDPDAITAALLPVFEVGRNWLKHKTGWAWL